MVWNLSDVVVFGEIINTRANSVHGYLAFRDRDQPVLVQLTGNCGPELAGRHLRFEVRPGSQPAQYQFDFGRFAMQQVGPTGKMTIEHVAQTDPGADAPPPRLYLEWFSQNGRVIIDLVDPILEFIEGDLPGRREDLDNIDDPALRSDELEPWEQDLVSDESDLPDFLRDDDESPDDEDPYGLFPDELQSHLDRSAAEMDAAIGLTLDDESLRIWEKWDEMFSGEKDEPLCTLFDPPLKLYPADRLNDDQIAQALDLLLARLALHGVALDMCEHYTPRDAYRLLTEQILREETVYPDLPSTGFVYHYMTSEFCEACEAEMDAAYGSDEEQDDSEDWLPDEE